MESGQASGQLPPKGGTSRPRSMLPVSLWLKEEEKGPTYRKFTGTYMVLPKSQLTISVVRTDANIPNKELSMETREDKSPEQILVEEAVLSSSMGRNPTGGTAPEILQEEGLQRQIMRI
ncbi:hypothetical protein DUI87_34661 [Hirundo rustica rustica]|uniref:Uncharacterized protein n=1 Tax=Hirundo rustica rustica TaxID=333673 RepID=A0A3M0IPW2_HIRRU|nr:hypothetical protein DUI87_34661 [Hirundo rustica rustica]